MAGSFRKLVTNVGKQYWKDKGASAMLRALVQLTRATKEDRVQHRHVQAAEAAIEAARAAGIEYFEEG